MHASGTARVTGRVYADLRWTQHPTTHVATLKHLSISSPRAGRLCVSLHLPKLRMLELDGWSIIHYELDLFSAYFVQKKSKRLRTVKLQDFSEGDLWWMFDTDIIRANPQIADLALFGSSVDTVLRLLREPRESAWEGYNTDTPLPNLTQLVIGPAVPPLVKDLVAYREASGHPLEFLGVLRDWVDEETKAWLEKRTSVGLYSDDHPEICPNMPGLTSTSRTRAALGVTASGGKSRRTMMGVDGGRSLSKCPLA